MTDPDPLIEQLRRERRRQGMTQRTLSDKTGISHVHIARIEGGHVEVRLSTLRRLATALGLQPRLNILSDPPTDPDPLTSHP